uniref:Uncharacterized protein n=1 Tax=Hemiselmis andersenii TaxID=464988 RepID=A0A7S1HJZ2_HEMAN
MEGMHSVYAVKKKRRDEEHVKTMRARNMNLDPWTHTNKTNKLANRYEVRVDNWMRDGEEKERIAPDPTKTSVFHHKFRDRSPERELANASISPRRYTTEALRIADALSASHREREPYTGKPIALFRARNKDGDIHADSTMRFKPRNSKQRIAEHVAGNLVAEQPPWTRYDHPTHQRSRDVKKSKWVGGGCVDFDLSPHLKDAWPHDFVAANAPYALAFGARAEDFRERNPELEHSGEFLNNVPGYFPDNTKGKWQMDYDLGRPVRHDWKGTRSPPATPLFHAGEGPFAGGSEVMNTSTSTKRVVAGRVASPKSYWKASTQISVQKKEAVERYLTIPDRPFEQHQERASTASSMLHDHNLNCTSPRSRGASSPKGRGGTNAMQGTAASG